MIQTCFAYWKILFPITVVCIGVSLASCLVMAAEDDTVVNDEVMPLVQVLEDGRRVALNRLGKVIVIEKVAAGGDHQFVVNQIVFGTDRETGHENLEGLLKQHIRELTAKYDLNEHQQRKLTLAGLVDIHRYLDETQTLCHSFAAMKDNLEEQRRITLTARAQQQRQLKLFGPGSFMAKVAISVLVADQISAQRPEEEYRQRMRHRSNIEGAIRAIERKVVLSISQQDTLVRLLLNEFGPPCVFGDYDDIVIKYQFARLPDSKLQPLFEGDQWHDVREVLDSFLEHKSLLSRHDLIEEESGDVKAGFRLLAGSRKSVDAKTSPGNTRTNASSVPVEAK